MSVAFLLDPTHHTHVRASVGFLLEPTEPAKPVKVPCLSCDSVTNAHARALQNGGYNGYGGGGGGGGYQRAAGHSSFHSNEPASDMGDPYRIEKSILVSGRSVPPPVPAFDRAGFTREILDEVRIRRQYVETTPIRIS